MLKGSARAGLEVARTKVGERGSVVLEGGRKRLRQAELHVPGWRREGWEGGGGGCLLGDTVVDHNNSSSAASPQSEEERRKHHIRYHDPPPFLRLKEPLSVVFVFFLVVFF